MTECLLLRALEHDTEHYEWACVADNLMLTMEPTSSLLVEIDSKKKHRDAILLLPGMETVITQVAIATTSYSKLKKAIPYLLEENLAHDIEELHFSFTKNDSAKSYTVAVNEKKYLTEQLQRLRVANIIPSKVLPDFIALPWSKDTWTIVITEQNILVRTGLNTGYACDLNNFASLLIQQYDEADESHKPNQINLINITKHDIMLPSDSIIPTDIFIIENNSEQTLVSLFAKGLATAPSKLNLLQGEFVTGYQWQRFNKIGLATTTLFAVWILTAFIGNIASYFYLSHRAKTLDSEITALYTHVFPDSTDVASPQLRFEEKLQQLETQQSDHGALVLLAKLGQVLQTHPGISILNTAYQNNQLTLSVTTNNFQSLQKFVSGLTAKNLRTQQENAKATTNGVSAELTISTFNES